MSDASFGGVDMFGFPIEIDKVKVYSEAGSGIFWVKSPWLTDLVQVKCARVPFENEHSSLSRIHVSRNSRTWNVDRSAPVPCRRAS